MIASQHHARSINVGVAWFTPVSIPDGGTRWPNDGFGVGTGTSTISAVLNSTLSSIMGVYAPAPPVGNGRFRIQSHDGAIDYLTLRMTTTQGVNVGWRFGASGILIPGPWRVLWTADVGGNGGPAFFSLFYKDYTERDVK